jgi:hypothetical protein
MPPGKAFDRDGTERICLAALTPMSSIADMAVPGPATERLPFRRAKSACECAIVGKELSQSKAISVEEWFRALGQNLLASLPPPAQAPKETQKTSRTSDVVCHTISF